MQEMNSTLLDELTLSVSSNKVLRSLDAIDKQQRPQLQFLINNPNFWWLDSLEDCFERRQVDDGILIYKQLHASSETSIAFHYWVGYFGGNPRGYLLFQTIDNDVWKVLIENCDTDFIWRGQGPVPKQFIKQVKMCAYGDKYREDVDG